jgi:succinate dehydrogenase / fumarate reductase cytochrome b subunit
MCFSFLFVTMLLVKLNRSLSPHLFVYKSYVTSVMSIFHRITGFIYCLLFFVCSVYFVLLYSFFSCYSLVFFIFVIINAIFFIASFIFLYHVLNGIRHITWGFCIGLNIHNTTTTGFLIFFLCLFFISCITIF